MLEKLGSTLQVMRLALLSVLLAVGCRHTQAQVLGDVFIYTNNYTFDPFPDLPADFGPEVPDEGIDGLLRVADPEDACSPFTFSDAEQAWVALISRSQQRHPTNCTFDVKVRHAAAAGAAAAIVYDDVYEALIIMSKPRDHPEPGIPAVFVSEKAGIIMRKLITPGQTRVRIVPVSASAWMSLVMSAFLGFLALTVVLATFYVMRSWSVWLGRTRGRRQPAEAGGGAGYGGAGQPIQAGLPACAIRALPVLVFEGAASRRQRSAPLPSLAPPAAAAAAGQPPRSSHVPVSGVSCTGAAGRPASGLQQQQQGIRPWQAAAAGAADGGADAAAEAALRAAAVFFPTDVLSSSAPAAVSSRASSVPVHSSSSSTRLHAGPQQEQQQASPAGPSQPTTAAAAAAAAAELLEYVMQCSPRGTPLSSPGMSSDDDEPEPIVCAVTGVITAGPPGACGGATRRSCVVCLERYVAGDKVRVLPCQHRFHARCIDPWLANRRLCPVCKHDASQPPPPALQRELEAAAAAAAAALGSAARAGGDGSSNQSPGNGGTGFAFLRRLRARFGRDWQQQPAAAAAAPGGWSATVPLATSAAGGSAMRPGHGVDAAGVVQQAAASRQQPLPPAAAYAAAAAAADAAEAGLLLPGGLAAVAGVMGQMQQHQRSLSQQQQQQQQQQQRWRSRQRSAQRQFRQLAGLSQQDQHSAANLAAPLLPGGGSSSSVSRAVSGSSSRAQGRGVEVPAHMLRIPRLTPAQSVDSAAGSPFAAHGRAA